MWFAFGYQSVISWDAFFSFNIFQNNCLTFCCQSDVNWNTSICHWKLMSSCFIVSVVKECILRYSLLPYKLKVTLTIHRFATQRNSRSSWCMTRYTLLLYHVLDDNIINRLTSDNPFCHIISLNSKTLTLHTTFYSAKICLWDWLFFVAKRHNFLKIHIIKKIDFTITWNFLN